MLLNLLHIIVEKFNSKSQRAANSMNLVSVNDVVVIAGMDRFAEI